MKVKGLTKVKGPTEVNFKPVAVPNFFGRSARKLIPYSSTFEMMAPLLNVVHYSTSPDPVSNSMFFVLKRGRRKRVGKRPRPCFLLLSVIVTEHCPKSIEQISPLPAGSINAHARIIRQHCQFRYRYVHC